MKVTQVKALENIANKIRIDVIEAVYNAQSGHIGGSLSIADIMAVLYFNEMNIDSSKPRDLSRDRFVMSKGHATPAYYSTLAERGFFAKEFLHTFRQLESPLQGHPDMNKVLGVDMTTGSLGQGFSVANGMAINSKIDQLGYRVYVLLGDGELEEGQIWEAAMTAAKYKLDNLCVIVDCNKLQLTGKTKDVKGLDDKDIEAKFKAFGFNTKIIDGHNINEIIEAFDEASTVKEKPSCIIANTIKGKGVSFMENNVEWHGKAVNEREYTKAINELKNLQTDNVIEAKIVEELSKKMDIRNEANK